MIKAQIKETVNLNYKNGYVECSNCHWKKELGNGFDGYILESCPNCDNKITTRDHRKVIFWDKSRNSLKAEIGRNTYFVLSNGIHIRFNKYITKTAYGTERYLDSL